MNVERFKEEFTELRRRFTAIDIEKNSQFVATALTNQEILEAVYEVLNMKLDVTLMDSMSDDIKTPASGIVMTTPNAPDIQKINIEHNGGLPGRFRSLDTLTSESLRNSPVEDLILPEPGPLTSKDNDEIDVVTIDMPDVHSQDKKYMSKSSPSVSTLVRSDTFVREEEFQSVENGDFPEPKNVDPVATNGGTEHSMTDAKLTEMFKKLIALKDSATDVINKINDLQKGVPVKKVEKIRPIRRLSEMAFPGLNRTTTVVKTTQRTKMTRRSMAAFPGTPTSSRLSPNPADSKDAVMRRKSASALSLDNIGGSKLSIPSTYRSVSSGALVVPKKSPVHSSPAPGSQLSGVKPPKTPAVRSPALSLLNIANKSAGRQTKNTKYAHVQSTIPKPGATPGNRKAN